MIHCYSQSQQTLQQVSNKPKPNQSWQVWQLADEHPVRGRQPRSGHLPQVPSVRGHHLRPPLARALRLSTPPDHGPRVPSHQVHGHRLSTPLVCRLRLLALLNGSHTNPNILTVCGLSCRSPRARTSPNPLKNLMNKLKIYQFTIFPLIYSII